MIIKPIILLGTALVTALVGAPGAVITSAYVQSKTPKEMITTYDYDESRDRWVKTVQSTRLPLNEDGTKPKSSNTVIINLKENDPVKEIVIEEALVMGGNEPLLEISGHADNISGTGKIRIGKLAFIKVDAKKLEIEDTDVVRVTLQNAVAEDNELDIDVDVVNVVRILRGAASTLRLGVSLFDRFQRIIPKDPLQEEDIQPHDTGIRVDRIRILGPNTGKAFVERIIIRRTGVAGRIEVRDVEIQDLVLIDVTVED